jgi:hypothetical protein
VTVAKVLPIRTCRPCPASRDGGIVLAWTLPSTREPRHADPAAARLPAPLCRSGRHRGDAAGGADRREPVPAQPQRRHHQQRGGQGRRPLHLGDRRRHAGHHPDGRRGRRHRGVLGVTGGHGGWRGPADRGIHPGPGILRPRGERLRHAVADHPQYQRSSRSSCSCRWRWCSWSWLRSCAWAA